MSRSLKDSWLKAYLVYTANQESPESFHIWVGLSMIAGAVRRQVFFDMGYFLVYPNLYVVLCSPAGRCKKSTAIRLGSQELTNVPGAKISGDSTTREKLAQDMSLGAVNGHSSLTVVSSELGSFFASSAMDMVTFLTDIYDCPPTWTHKTKISGTTSIKAPYLNLIAGTTPDWIASSMPFETVGIGFTSRVIFVYSNDPRPASPFPKLSESQKQIKKLILNDLTHISTRNGEFTITDEAYVFYEKWYIARFNTVQEHDPRTIGYHERKHIHVLKVAMLLSLAEKDELLLTVKNITDAIELLEAIEPGMSKTFSAVGKNPLSLDLEQIDSQVQRSPDGVSFSDLLETYKYSIDKDQLIMVMDTLTIIKHVKVAIKGDQTYYFPGIATKEHITKVISAA